MKNIVTILLFFISIISQAQPYVYYVQDPAYDATYGSTASDANAGTNINLPWATWQKAFTTAEAGDTVYFRGGTWTPTTKAYGGKNVTLINPAAGRGHNGTHDAPIVYMAYPSDYATGNFPILDCEVACDSSRYGNGGLGIEGGATYIKFKGLTVRNTHMWDLDLDGGGRENCGNIAASEVGNVYFENMTSYNSGGAGLWVRTYDTVYIVNCDVYNCCDSLENGGDGDGITASARGALADSAKYTYITGCRVWNVSDDGFDIGSTKELHIFNNWAFNIGNQGTGCPVDFGDPTGSCAGDGNGFKFSYGTTHTLGKRVIANNITAYNASWGIVEQNLLDERWGNWAEYYHNFSYNEYGGFGTVDNQYMGWNYSAGEPFPYPNDLEYIKTIMANNIAYQYSYNFPAVFMGADYVFNIDGVPYVSLYTSSFVLAGTFSSQPNPAFTVSDADFVSLDSAELRTARQADGSLPIIDFGHLAQGSDLITGGTDMGLLFDGDGLAFDDDTISLGPFQYAANAPEAEPIDSSLKYITGYIFSEQTGIAVIDTSAKTVAIEVEAGTDVTGLVASFSLSEGATAAIGSTPQVSGTTENDFTDPVTYVVTALDASTQEWIITVTVEDEPVPLVATVGTTSADYTAITANVTGIILTANGGTLTERGVCWSTTNTSPTVSDKRTLYTPYVGSYTDIIRGLRANTTYYFRAYATTSEGGTSYGDAISFTTRESSVPTQSGKPLFSSKHGNQLILAK